MSNEKTKIMLKYLEEALMGDAGFIEPDKDFSILQDFTDQELIDELLRRTELGKELL